MTGKPPRAGSKIIVEFTPEELELIRWGLEVWNGPGRPSAAQIQAFGFTDARCLVDAAAALWHALRDATGLTPSDWSRLLELVEIGFISDVQGAGVEWYGTTGITDVDAIRLLRAVQMKLLRSRTLYQPVTGEPRNP
jgi:hypothetical protein